MQHPNTSDEGSEATNIDSDNNSDNNSNISLDKAGLSAHTCFVKGTAPGSPKWSSLRVAPDLPASGQVGNISIPFRNRPCFPFFFDCPHPHDECPDECLLYPFILWCRRILSLSWSSLVVKRVKCCWGYAMPLPLRQVSSKFIL